MTFSYTTSFGHWLIKKIKDKARDLQKEDNWKYDLNFCPSVIRPVNAKKFELCFCLIDSRIFAFVLAVKEHGELEICFITTLTGKNLAVLCELQILDLETDEMRGTKIFDSSVVLATVLFSRLMKYINQVKEEDETVIKFNTCWIILGEEEKKNTIPNTFISAVYMLAVYMCPNIKTATAEMSERAHTDRFHLTGKDWPIGATTFIDACMDVVESRKSKKENYDKPFMPATGRCAIMDVMGHQFKLIMKTEEKIFSTGNNEFSGRSKYIVIAVTEDSLLAILVSKPKGGEAGKKLWHGMFYTSIKQGSVFWKDEENQDRAPVARQEIDLKMCALFLRLKVFLAQFKVSPDDYELAYIVGRNAANDENFVHTKEVVSAAVFMGMYGFIKTNNLEIYNKIYAEKMAKNLPTFVPALSSPIVRCVPKNMLVMASHAFSCMEGTSAFFDIKSKFETGK